MISTHVDTGYRGIPSRQHEARRSTLETIATLAGFTVPLPFPRGVIPDVSRISLWSGSIFVGEAKQSEDVNDLKAVGRIETYIRWLSLPRRRTHPDLFCVCHPIHHAGRWQPALESIADAVGANRVSGGTTVLTYDAALTWVTCAGR